jgi:hypothetical protein
LSIAKRRLEPEEEEDAIAFKKMNLALLTPEG